MSINSFATRFELSDEVAQALKILTIERAGDRRVKWIRPPYDELIIQELQTRAIDIIDDCLMGEDTPELLVLSSSSEAKIWIYSMDDVLNYVRIPSTCLLLQEECLI